jgi:hypothetical protein
MIARSMRTRRVLDRAPSPIFGGRGEGTAAQLHLVPPWHFHEAILKPEAGYLESGGRLIFPLS